MLALIKKLLLKVIEDIDTGNCYIDESEGNKIIEIIKSLSDKTQKLSKYQACTYLNISRASFDNYIREGKIPKGKKEAGFKELFWCKKDLDTYVNITK